MSGCLPELCSSYVRRAYGREGYTENMSVKGLLEQEAFSGDIDELNEHVHDPGDPDGIVEAERDGAPRRTYAGSTRRKRRWPWLLLVIIVLAGVAYGAYWYGTQQTSKSTPKAATPAPTKSAPVTTSTTHYDSATYSLGFDYPSTWKLSDTTGKLTVTSPSTQLSGLDGKTVGRVIITVQNQQTAIPDFPANGAMASIASDMVTYKQPSEVQRAQTYLSYLGYQSPNGLDALYISGDSGYQAGQQVPMGDIVKGNPLIGITFEACGNSDCAAGTTGPLTLRASDWKSSPLSTVVTGFLESIVVH